MKKVILVLAFVFGSSNLVNANNSVNELLFGDCTAEAWEVGTMLGEGNEEDEYYYTNTYFQVMCNDDGSYRNKH